MIISVRAIPRAKKERIVERGGVIRIYVGAPPEDGRANEAVIKLLAEHFAISKSQIKIIKGETSRDKTIELLNK